MLSILSDSITKHYDYQTQHENHPEYILYGSETSSSKFTRESTKFRQKEQTGLLGIMTIKYQVMIWIMSLGVVLLIQNSKNRMTT